MTVTTGVRRGFTLTPVHPFPARMAPRIAQRKLALLKTSTVLDPMMGSGTTLATARQHGHHAIGFDTDPLAVMLTKSWCADVAPGRLRTLGERVLIRARLRSKTLTARDGYPHAADAETKRYIRYWFDDKSRVQLAALADAIRQSRDPNMRTLLWCAFSRLIITKDAGVSLARDVSHSRPHKAFVDSPMKPFDVFLKAIDRVDAALESGRPARASSVRAERGDARALPLSARSVDAVITSPPYLNALDYMRGHRLALVWMGHRLRSLRRIRSSSVGTEAGVVADAFPSHLAPALGALGASRLDDRHAGMLRRYVRDMNLVTAEIARVVRPNGIVIFVVGDSTLRGVHVRNSSAIRKLSEAHGLRLVRRSTRTIPENRRYLPPPGMNRSSGDLGRRMRREVVLEFTKVADI